MRSVLYNTIRSGLSDDQTLDDVEQTRERLTTMSSSVVRIVRVSFLEFPSRVRPFIPFVPL